MTGHAPITQNLQLRTLGDAVVTRGGQPLEWPARSAEDLLWYLHAHPGGAYRADLLMDLWGLEDTPAAANRFRVALHRLRATLGSVDAVAEVRGRYALHPDLLTASDTAALQEGLQAARLARTDAEREEALRRALACVEGEYLPQVRADWVEEARAYWRSARVRAHVSLALLHCARRECPLAAQALGRAVQADPLIGEDHHQRLMTCLAQTRGRYEAVEHYRRYRRYLRQEVGDTPMPDTVELAERLKAGELICLEAERELGRAGHREDEPATC
ncbi:response regulator receiver/SARP domain-containing protein [Deinococcus aerius]|uniref:Response regulator receiver/SARP domain-containing protein n=1 Tax=Deinococcus aerius TaxID=200253 RepID=A0A2I9DPU7_9DEIO|nr:BTAD domain-containing putative transcriptional regulator [Deinococcus aerius]GBF07221.1 response regulator receiver/SARP domain-containing protein [Deinococcus aerius]